MSFTHLEHCLYLISKDIIICVLMIYFFFLEWILNIKLMTKVFFNHMVNSFILSLNRDAVKTHPVLGYFCLSASPWVFPSVQVYCPSLMKLWEENRPKTFVLLSLKIDGDFLFIPQETCLLQDKGFIKRGKILNCFPPSLLSNRYNRKRH